MTKVLLMGLISLALCSGAAAQTMQREEGEEAESFVRRLTPPDAVLAHHVIETNRWCHPDKMVIACYGYNDSIDSAPDAKVFASIAGHVYMPASNGNYHDLIFGPIEEDGGKVQIVSIFFSNADYDTTKEMFVLCQYFVKNYDFEGYVYKTFIYDNPTAKQTELTLLKELSEKFDGMEGSWRDGKVNRAKYKSAKEIRAKLKQMGYR